MKEEKKFLQSYISKDDICVLALSGGPDSMCLLSLLLELGISVVCVHINHHTRVSCERDYAFVRDYLQKRGIPLEYFAIDRYESGKFTEQEARDFRYERFREVVLKYRAKCLLTAHHGDDLTETILMRILRGSTLEGYAGIQRKSLWNDIVVLRPLLTVRKKDIYAYLDEHHVPYVEDESNLDDSFLRNRLRHTILPFFGQENPNYHRKMLQFSEVLLGSNSLIKEEVKRLRASIEQDQKINVLAFKQLSLEMKRAYAESYLSDVYQEDIKVISKQHVRLFIEMIENARSSCMLDFPKQFSFVKQNGWCFLQKKQKFEPYCIKVSKSTILPNGDRLEQMDSYGEKSNYYIHLRTSDVCFPLYLTTRKAGMKMEVKNLHGSKKVNDILIDEHIPQFKKDAIPILIDSNGKVLWILGLKKSKYDLEKDESYDIIYKYIKREEK